MQHDRSGRFRRWPPRWRRLAVALAGAWLALAASDPTRVGVDAVGPRAPDLRTVPPNELTFDRVFIRGERRHVLRFTNTVWNAGEGPLELRGNPESGELVQRVDDGAGGVVDLPLADAAFVYHANHDHWHLADFARYELRERGSGQRQAFKARRAKTSFCVMDTERIQDLPGGPASRVFTTCQQDVQGVSVGWADTYRFSIPDQWIVIGAKPLVDGRYALRSVADPGDILDEGETAREDEASNGAKVCFAVRGGKIRMTAC